MYNSWLRGPVLDVQLWFIPPIDGDFGDAWSNWWLITLSKWVLTPVISGLTLLIPFIPGVIAHLLSGVSHQVGY